MVFNPSERIGRGRNAGNVHDGYVTITASTTHVSARAAGVRMCRNCHAKGPYDMRAACGMVILALLEAVPRRWIWPHCGRLFFCRSAYVRYDYLLRWRSASPMDYRSR